MQIISNKENIPPISFKGQGKKIRLNAKQHFYTYPRLKCDLFDLLEHLRTQWESQNIEITQFIVAHELHKDGYPHRHVYLELNSPPIGNTPTSFLDYHDDSGNYHGNYQTAKNPARVIGYCSKGEDYVTNYTPVEMDKFKAKYLSLQEKKMSKAEVGTRLLNGTSLEDLVAEYPQLIFDYMKLKNSINAYMSNTRKLADLTILDNEWRWGDTGAGKSKYCRENYPGFFLKNREMYWNGYNGEAVVVLEDVDKSWLEVIEQFKIWADHYPFMALMKLGDPIRIRPYKIVVTSNYTIEELLERCGNKDKQLKEALERRFNQIYMKKVDPLDVELDWIFHN